MADLSIIQGLISNVGFPIAMSLLLYFHLTKIILKLQSSLDNLTLLLQTKLNGSSGSSQPPITP